MPEISPALIDNLGLGLVVLLVGAANYWKARRAEQAGKASAQAGDDVRRTLTTNNGGSHVRDQLDRIETRQVRLEKAFNDHLEHNHRRGRLWPLLTLWRLR